MAATDAEFTTAGAAAGAAAAGGDDDDDRAAAQDAYGDLAKDRVDAAIISINLPHIFSKQPVPAQHRRRLVVVAAFTAAIAAINLLVVPSYKQLLLWTVATHLMGVTLAMVVVSPIAIALYLGSLILVSTSEWFHFIQPWLLCIAAPDRITHMSMHEHANAFLTLPPVHKICPVHMPFTVVLAAALGLIMIVAAALLFVQSESVKPLHSSMLWIFVACGLYVQWSALRAKGDVCTKCQYKFHFGETGWTDEGALALSMSVAVAISLIVGLIGVAAKSSTAAKEA